VPSNDIAGSPRIMDEDYLIRRIEAIERAQRELRPSLMGATADAIRRLVVPAAIYQYYTNQTFGAEPDGGYLSTSLTTPDGFTKALVALNLSVTAYKPAATASCTMVAQPSIGGVAGALEDTRISTYPYIYILRLPMTQVRLVTGLDSGDAIDLSAYIATDPGLPANASNTAKFSGTVLWFN
jgi:hypothetical protein